MAPDGTAAARHELLNRLRDVLKAVRLFKNEQPPRQTAVLSGTLGVLAKIGDLGTDAGCHSKDLAAEFALDPSTISRAVASLVRAGLVRRAADPNDGRASVLALTPHGREVLDEATRWYDGRLADALRDWTVQDLNALADMLQRFSDDLIARFDPNQTLEAAR
jgi:DNA-binding MarR family transcriptional regulator